MSDHPAPFRLSYRLAEADIHAYCSASWTRRCWWSWRHRKAAMVLLLALVLFLVAICFRSGGLRGGFLALWMTFVCFNAFVWSRAAWEEQCIQRIAGRLGIPRELRLLVSTEGIAEESDPEIPGPAHTFAWSEVVVLDRIDHLNVIRLRPAGGTLIVPDSAFASPDRRAEFEETLRTWRDEALARSARLLIPPPAPPVSRG